MTDTLTVTDALLELKIPEGRLVKSSLGRMIAKHWREQTGENPSQPYGRKANGPGGHNLAAYPRSFFPEMQRLIEHALTLTTEELEQSAPLPADVREALGKIRKARDVTPAGSDFWWSGAV